ncbi:MULTISPECIES: hypothetical protein [Halomicrobium]|uniref:Major facilitator superfamily (MFS) profile domain-containing protein n=2 Tax=Halomicrobium mukohataei TaxID=57705 RepID=C7NXS3_HALMD|nr:MULTISPECIES: hypothetical protein [Halomicrobium]ACV46511.1 hypothetical protein Hmuk_0374 [Halomicrobium mukohataei DSM 12286]QCD65057.1 hypothetical protein E5139_05155 [Halomicrobium mukohataei]QFR19863.1 hypothetical protein GBQ70_05150 [Halomicrobium sp. ZPS1]
MDTRTVLAAVLGVGLGLVFLAAPGAVRTAYSVGRSPQDRRGEYGSAERAGRRVHSLIRAVGAAFVLVGLYVGWQALAV